MTLDDLIRRLTEGSGGGFDPYQQPGMGMGYGPSFGAGAAAGPPMDLSGYRGPARGLPTQAPGPGQLNGGMSGGYGPAQGANGLEAVLQLIAQLLPVSNMRPR